MNSIPRLRWWVVALCLVAHLFAMVHASSSMPPPLRALAYVEDVQVERVHASPSSLDRRQEDHESVTHADAFRLSFSAFQNRFHLHLQPTEHLIPPQGLTVRYTSTDPATGKDVVSRRETIHAHEVRAYRGVVVHERYTERRLLEDRVGVYRGSEPANTLDDGIMGHASILLLDDGSQSGQARFEGTFSWAGNEHVIQTSPNYQSVRSPLDPKLRRRALEEGTMVLHRRSDRMDVRATTAEGQDAQCQSDSYDFNIQNALRIPQDDAEGEGEVTRLPFTSFFALPQRTVKLGRRTPHNALLARSRLASPLDAGFLDSRTPATNFQYGLTLHRRQDDVMGDASNNSYIDDIGSTAGCPSANRVVYIGVATDCTYTARFANSSAARTQVLNNVNSVSNIYRNTFRVSLGVVELDIRESNNCPTTSTGDAPWNRACDESYGLDQRLSDFSQWRANQPANGVGLWHLLTLCSSGSEVGVAWLGTLCKTDSSGSGNNVVSGTGVTAATGNEILTMAHEIAHNLGAVHDCIQSCSVGNGVARQSGGSGPICCPSSSSSCNSQGNYIMSPYSMQNTGTNQFSPCSVGNICSMFGQGLDTSCVVDPSENGRTTLSVQQCGNGILEPGEECDAGPDGSSCCTTQCKLTEGAKCDPLGTECCTDSCQFANSTTVCRPAVDGRCDMAETCTGTNAQCPTDIRKDDGTSCGNGLSCAAGVCTSRDLQCQQQQQSTQSGLNLTRACPTDFGNSCRLSCLDPSQPATCLQLSQDFLDGTSCGYGGRCQSGQCRSGNWQSTVSNWYRDNLRISIPITIIVGLLVLTLLYWLVRCCCLSAAGGRAGKKRQSAVRYSQPPQQRGSRRVPPPPPPPRHSMVQQPMPTHQQSYPSYYN